jgi:type II secretory pathway predicted ATPase ExeA
MNQKLQSLYGLKFNPFRPDVPVEALFVTPAVDTFLRRVELGIADGGYISIIGDPGTGKSAVLRLLKKNASKRCAMSWSASLSTPNRAPWTFIASLVICSLSSSARTTAGAVSKRFEPAGPTTSLLR